jgi:hypothetical protein
MTKKSKRDRRVARPQVVGPIDVYKRPMTEVEQRDEQDALTWEQPEFAIPALDELLEGVGRDVDRMWLIYKLGTGD